MNSKNFEINLEILEINKQTVLIITIKSQNTRFVKKNQTFGIKKKVLL